jgi:hypothetical protein
MLSVGESTITPVTNNTNTITAKPDACKESKKAPGAPFFCDFPTVFVTKSC